MNAFLIFDFPVKTISIFFFFSWLWFQTSSLLKKKKSFPKKFRMTRKTSIYFKSRHFVFFPELVKKTTFRNKSFFPLFWLVFACRFWEKKKKNLDFTSNAQTLNHRKQIEVKNIRNRTFYIFFQEKKINHWAKFSFLYAIIRKQSNL